jgi:cytochrome P450
MLPVIGNLLQVRPSRMHTIVEEWSRRYGPLFRFRIRHVDILAVADSAVLTSVLRDRPDGFRRADRMRMAGEGMGLDPGVFAAEGESWRRQSALVKSAFDPRHVNAFLPSLARVVARLHARWVGAARRRDPIDLHADLMRFTVDAIGGLALGADINTLESGDDVIQRHLNRIFPALFKRMLAPIQYWHYVRLPGDRQLERSVAAVKSAIDGFIAQARARMRSNPALRDHPQNLLEAMIVAADADAGIGERDVAGNVLTMLLAGEDTTANTLAWMIYLMYSNPPALRRAREQVDRVATLPAVTLEQLDALDFLDGCARETMRLKPAAPVVGLQALRETSIADVRVPAGTFVWGVIRHDSVDERYYPRPDQFRPERWLEGESDQVTAAARRASMPFGAGPRICPGRNLAMLEMKLVVAMLVGCFEIESVATEDEREPRERMAFTMAPVGLRMKLRERSTGAAMVFS